MKTVLFLGILGFLIPATIQKFDYTVKNDRIYLHWTVNDNSKADRFELQSSTDGKTFRAAALVFGTDRDQDEQYEFFEKKSKDAKTYRLAVIQKDQTANFYPVDLKVK